MKSAPFFAAFVFTAALVAQDTRNVTEPRIPPVCTVVTAHLTSHGASLAPEDEGKLDTDRIQQAVDGCAPGKAVELRSNGTRNAFVSGPLELGRGVALLIDADTTLYASRDPRLFDVSPGACGVVNDDGRGCKPLIAVNAPDAAVMGDGVIDGRGGEKLLGQNVSYWDLAQEAKVKNAHQNCPRLIVGDRADNFVLHRITLRNSPNFHVIVHNTNGFTAWGIKIDSPKYGRNSDGIDPSSSKNVSILYSYIRAGDDNVAIKASASGPAEHITVAHNHFYAGHGMSIGSETQGGVTAVRVTDLTIDGADNGIRIKSNPTRGGLVHDVSYEDVCIRGVKNPLVMETTYEGQTAGTLIPRFEDVALHNVRVLGGGKIAIAGFDPQHPVQATFDGVVLSGVRPDQVQVANAKLETGPGQVNFQMSGPGVEIVKLAGDHKVLSCDGRFVPFPGSAPAAAKPVSTAERSQVVVATDGSGAFRSLQAAVDALPESGGIITIRPGVYRETVRITKPNVRLEGPADPSQVVIVFDKSAATSGGTLNSATVDISGDDFSARGVTFENDFSKRSGSTPNQGGQAIALAVSGDRAGFQNVRILGAQDTLFVGSKGCASEQGPCTPARQYFSDCYIEGHVDFIFGDAKAVFSHCEIHAIARNTVYLTAQSRHYAGQESGFVFDHCKVTADADAKSIWMGRPWRPFATVVFLNTDIHATIEPAGWREWHPGETHSLDTAFYAEYHSAGSGAAGPRDPHTHILSDAEAQQFLPAKFLAGADAWNPEAPRQVAHATAGEKQ